MAVAVLARPRPSELELLPLFIPELQEGLLAADRLLLKNANHSQLIEVACCRLAFRNLCFNAILNPKRRTLVIECPQDAGQFGFPWNRKIPVSQSIAFPAMTGSSIVGFLRLLVVRADSVNENGSLSVADNEPSGKRVKGIGPSPTAWEAVVLPLNYTRDAGTDSSRISPRFKPTGSTSFHNRQTTAETAASMTLFACWR